MSTTTEQRECRIEMLKTEPILIQLGRELEILGASVDRMRDRWGTPDRRFADAVWDEILRRDEDQWVLTPAMGADEPAEALLRILEAVR